MSAVNIKVGGREAVVGVLIRRGGSGGKGDRAGMVVGEYWSTVNIRPGGGGWVGRGDGVGMGVEIGV